MSEQWRGLYHPDRHEPMLTPARAWCECGTWCTRDWECLCCLATEVERLRAELAYADRLIESLTLRDQS